MCVCVCPTILARDRVSVRLGGSHSRVRGAVGADEREAPTMWKNIASKTT